MGEKYFSQFDALLIDETHQAKANSLKGICEKMTDCQYKIGLTGTLDDLQTSKLVLEGLLRPVIRTIKTKELMDRGSVAKLHINAMVFKYTDEERQLLKKAKYADEVKWLEAHPRRLNMICGLAAAQKKTGLILFTKIEHGKSIYDKLVAENPKRNIHFVSGSVPAEDREQIRKWAETDKDGIIVASYGVFSTGVSIKNINWLILGSPTKSKIRTLQSIGRALRMNSVKKSATLYDIVDDLSWKSHQNYALKHYLERASHYSKEEFDISTYSVKI
jgi:superfamily II DNA or RNA helicase